MPYNYYHRRGFTLIELLVTLAIITVLAGLLMPVLTSARAAARTRVCASNLRQVGAATLMYAQDWDEALPQTPPFPVTPDRKGALNVLRARATGTIADSLLAQEFFAHEHAILGGTASTLARMMVESDQKLGDGVFTCPSDTGEAQHFDFSGGDGTVAYQAGTSYLWDPAADYPLGQNPINGQDLGSIQNPTATRLWEDYGARWHLTLRLGHGVNMGELVTVARVNCAFADGHVGPAVVQEESLAPPQPLAVALRH